MACQNIELVIWYQPQQLTANSAHTEPQLDETMKRTQGSQRNCNLGKKTRYTRRDLKKTVL